MLREIITKISRKKALQQLWACAALQTNYSNDSKKIPESDYSPGGESNKNLFYLTSQTHKIHACKDG